MNKPCEHCATNFDAPRGNQKYCSRKCANRVRELRRAVPCTQCGHPRTSGGGDLGASTLCRACRGYGQGLTVEKSCPTCGVAFLRPSGRPTTYCSPGCVNPGRECEVCGDRYRASYAKQRTCGRICGVALKASRRPAHAPKPLAEPKPPYCRIFVKRCDQCDREFNAKAANSKRCSTQCRIDAQGVRVMDLYALVRQDRGTRPWRQYLVELLRERDGVHCALCLMRMDFTLKSGPRGDDAGVSVDHIVPRSKGGADDLDNLQLAHWGCNRTKRANVFSNTLFDGSQFCESAA